MPEVLLAGAVRGLVSEGERISQLVSTSSPEVVGLSISKEALIAMEEYVNAGKDDARLDNLEEAVYVRELSKFGELKKPPPCFVEAWKTAIENNIVVKPLDMNDDQYTTAYCRNVSTVELLTLGRRDRKIYRYDYQATTPEEFVLEWDKIMTKSKGFRQLEKEREEFMTHEIAKLSKESSVLAVVELERLAGIKEQLQKTGVAHQIL